MLGLQGGSSSPKVYRCVACSASFGGLASLLVHQATHAGTLAKICTPPRPPPRSPPTQPNPGQNEPPSESTGSTSQHTNKHSSPPAVPSDNPSASLLICECGEEFQDVDLMLEHKRSHDSPTQPFPPPESVGVPPSGAGGDKIVSAPVAESLAPASETGLMLTHTSPLKSPAAEVPALNAQEGDGALEGSVAMETSPQGHCLTPEAVSEEQLESVCDTAEQILETVPETLLEAKSIDRHEKGDNLPRTDTLMRMLASAYTNRFASPLSPTGSLSDLDISPKEEDMPVDITPEVQATPPPFNDLSVDQLRRLLSKPTLKTKSPSISTVLKSTRKKIVSLTKTFSPVIVLETRQQLMDSANKGTYGNYQCGRCRKVFPDVDRLTEHHFLHKKERIKCCRHCKQLIIGRLPFPDNHVCPQLRTKAMQLSSQMSGKMPFPPKRVQTHNAKKVYYCPMCKHTYARLWNLKTHRCQASAFPGQDDPLQRMLSLRSHENGDGLFQDSENEYLNSNDGSSLGSDITNSIKLELTSSNSEGFVGSQLPWSSGARRFSQFLGKSALNDQNHDLSIMSLQEGEVTSWDIEAIGEDDGNKRQWTVPLDDEVRALPASDEDGDDDNEMVHSSRSAELLEIGVQGLTYFVSDGVRRYPCGKCNKTYSRPTTLKRHLRLCGVRPPGFETSAPTNAQAPKPPKPRNLKMFPCFVCGKTFNRKDNMMVHRRRCQLQRAMGDARRPGAPGSSATDGQSLEDKTGNWGITGLPSVLPRRVTCECGVGFTSPKLLVEHLQKHAQESYTCPTCGETVNSWVDYEAHLQVHMHPHRQLSKGPKQPQPQPAVLRFQSQSAMQPSLKLQQMQHLSSLMRKQRFVCSKCGNSFATRCSLRRHLSWNRCKGTRPTSAHANPPKAHRCSQCNSSFPNGISLLFHHKSGACKPTVKPVRCPVCLRWFGSVESLQKHLLTHKQSETYRCDVCQGTYPNLKSLKNHRRRIHRILVGHTPANAAEQLAS